MILGNLSANGQVFLLNPNGVLFGAGSRVDVGGILASTLGLSNDDFLAGRYTLSSVPSATDPRSARGGSGGDGGFVEVSGKQRLGFGQLLLSLVQKRQVIQASGTVRVAIRILTLWV